MNTNKNYNAAAEAEAGIYGMRAIATYLELERRGLEQDARVVPVPA